VVTVTCLRAVDPATVGRKLAADRVAKSPVPVEYVGLNGEELPLADESVDDALSTWTLCTIPAVDRALTETCAFSDPAVPSTSSNTAARPTNRSHDGRTGSYRSNAESAEDVISIGRSTPSSNAPASS